MRRDRRFFAGLVAVAAVVSYLVWTGISATMLFFVTPAELIARQRENPESMARGVKVGARLVPGSYERGPDDLLHLFVVEDPDDPSVQLEVEFRHALPDTFTDDPSMEVEVVMQGVYRPDGVFEASEVLTRCGSRYEAMPENELASAPGGVIE